MEGLKASQRVSRRLARSHYENFLVASILLPRRFRQPFYNIYAFCRTADDLADESASPELALAALAELQQKLDATFAGQPPRDSFFPALAETIREYDLEQPPFDDLLSAFRQDQHLREYETNRQLIDYCRRSANPVGRILLQLGDCRNDKTEGLSDEICTGLQLANFWQDIARDRAIGRVYLPAEVRQQHGISTSMLDQPSTPVALRRLLANLCDDSEARFRRGLELVNHVPRWLATDVKLFAHGGLETLNAIRKIDFDVLRIRPTVGKGTQLRLVAKAMVGWI
jgi:squalene synthase HpnC